MTNPTFDIEYDVPRPKGIQMPLDPMLEQHGWWISDNTMRTLAEMSHIWFSDTCSDECDGYSDEERCPYGTDYAEACVISRRIIEAVKQAHEGGKK